MKFSTTALSLLSISLTALLPTVSAAPTPKADAAPVAAPAAAAGPVAQDAQWRQEHCLPSLATEMLLEGAQQRNDEHPPPPTYFDSVSQPQNDEEEKPKADENAETSGVHQPTPVRRLATGVEQRWKEFKHCYFPHIDIGEAEREAQAKREAAKKAKEERKKAAKTAEEEKRKAQEEARKKFKQNFEEAEKRLQRNKKMEASKKTEKTEANSQKLEMKKKEPSSSTVQKGVQKPPAASTTKASGSLIAAQDLVYNSPDYSKQQSPAHSSSDISEDEMKQILHYKRLSKEWEPQYKNLTLCFKCLAFHPSTEMSDPTNPHCDASAVSLGGRHLKRPLLFSEAHQVMRANRLGPGYGRGVEALSRHGLPNRFRSEWSSFTLRARLVDGRLLLKETWTLQPRMVPGMALCEVPKLLPGCVHCQDSGSLRLLVRSTIGTFAFADAKRNITSALYRCQWCPTELRIQAQRSESVPISSSSEQGESICMYDLVLYNWTDLGKCLSPYSREWVTLRATAPSNDQQRRSSFVQDPFDLKGLTTIESRYDSVKSVKTVALESVPRL
ncbi:MAG: hypothetical protein M1831_001246 [Alyxoria varia]|nr:MAG: hypothetical protein M1831_001246 [Alyxoria varia]